MSGSTLAPSKSTVYISSLPFSLTNNDIFQLCQNYGKVVKVTVVKDDKRRSKGVAFVLFLTREDAGNCVQELNGKQLFGRTLKAAMAKDNGRAAEFIRRREYPDKTKCYECGEFGHLSYRCPKNILGEREPPPKKKRIKRKFRHEEEVEDNESEEDVEEDPSLETLGASIRLEQERVAAESSKQRAEEPSSRKPKFKKSAYFSDEEEVADDD